MLHRRQRQSDKPIPIMTIPIARGRKRRPLAMFLAQQLKYLRDGEPERNERCGRPHPSHQSAFMGELEIGAFVGKLRRSVQPGRRLFVRRFFVHGRL
jgi:hypothetical protein